MTDARRIASIACFMLVTLRLMIGWQLLYEGFWKIKTLKSATPWTAAGYLRNAQGPLRDQFRQLAGDPDDLSWIDAKPIDPKKEGNARTYWVPGVERKWDAWHKKFVKHYDLDPKQQGRLQRMVNGAKTFEADLAVLPKSVDLEPLKSVISYSPERKRLVVDGKRHLIPDHRNKLEKAIDSDLDGIPNSADASGSAEGADNDHDKDGIIDEADVDATEGKDENGNGIDDTHVADQESDYLAALKIVFKRSKDGMSYKEKLRATVAGNPEWNDLESAQRVGEISKYKTMLAEYEEDLKEATRTGGLYPFHDKSFRFDHLQHTWGKIQTKRAELVGPVKALDAELKSKAQAMLRIDQIQKGSVGKTWTPLEISDMLTILGLTILGAMLILGFWTRFAAFMAAIMLFMFYAAIPPWPGVPAAPGPEHAFIVNKNFIEVIALLAIATLPTGRWWGVDGILGRWWGKRRLRKQEQKNSHIPVKM